jgi:exopolysaccharide biosynthesis polyprenyl glycosylphosphotransferase
LKPTKVAVGTEQLTDVALRAELARVNEQGVEVCSVANIFEADFGVVPLTCIDSSWFLFGLGPLHRLGYRFGRRLVDLVASVVFAVALAVLLPVIALAIRLDSPGPIFFSQERVGQGGRPFRIHKLRTMRTDAEAAGPQFAEHDDPRVTRIGAWLRRCRIDELPQALNLLRGEMSLIGPRPERPEFVATFSEAIPFYDKRHLIKPGITGWAQVHEGYGASHEDTIRKLERDLYYVLKQSLGVDLRIMLATVGSVFSFSGR